MEGVHEPDDSRRDDAAMPGPMLATGPDIPAHSTPVMGRAQVPAGPPDRDPVADDGYAGRPLPDDPAATGAELRSPAATADELAGPDMARPPAVGRARVAGAFEARTSGTDAGRAPAHQHIPVPRAAGPGDHESWFTPQREHLEDAEPAATPARGADDLPRRHVSGLPDYSAMPWLKLAERGHTPWSAFGPPRSAAEPPVAELTVTGAPGPDGGPAERPGTGRPAEPADPQWSASAMVGLAGSTPGGHGPTPPGPADTPPPVPIRAVARVPVPQPRTAPPAEGAHSSTGTEDGPAGLAATHGAYRPAPPAVEVAPDDATGGTTPPADDAVEIDLARGWRPDSADPDGSSGGGPRLDRFRETDTDDWYPNWRYPQTPDPAPAPAPAPAEPATTPWVPTATGTARVWTQPTSTPDLDPEPATDDDASGFPPNDHRSAPLAPGTAQPWTPAPAPDQAGQVPAPVPPAGGTDVPWRSALRTGLDDRRRSWPAGLADPAQRTAAPDGENLDRPLVVPRAIGPATEGEERLNLPQMGSRALAEARLAAIDQAEAESDSDDPGPAATEPGTAAQPAAPDMGEPGANAEGQPATTAEPAHAAGGEPPVANGPGTPTRRARTGLLGLVDDLPSPDIGPDLDLSTITGRHERVTEPVEPAAATPPQPPQHAGRTAGGTASVRPAHGVEGGVDDGTVTMALPTPAARPPAERDVRYDTIDWRKHIRGSVARESSTLYRDQQPPRPAATPTPVTAPPVGRAAGKAADEDDEKLSLADRIGRIMLLVGGIVLFIVLFLYGPQISRWWNS